MPSRYYNPRLAKNLAEAYKQEVYDFATPVSKAFKPFLEMTEKRYQEKLKEKEKYDLQKEKLQKEQNSFFADMPIIDPKTLDSSIRDYATQDMFALQQEYRFAVENLQGYDRIKRTGEIKNNMEYYKTINNNMATYQANYKDMHNPSQEGGDRMSKVNDSITVEMDRRKANKEFDSVVEGEDGRLYAVFEPREDSAIEETTLVAFDDWNKAYVPVERQTKKYVDTLASFDRMIDVAKREKRWETDPANQAELESTLNSLEFTKDEALSIAVDQLGMEQEEYAGLVMRDLDNDGVPGTIDDINMFIKDNLKQGVTTQLTNLREAYEKQIQASTDVKPPTATEIKEQKRVDNYNYVGDALEQFKAQMQQGQPDIIKDQVNWLQVESPFFKDMASGMGFSGFVNVTGENDEVIAVEVTNEVTNNKAYIPVGTNTEGVIKRLMIAAGATPKEADMYYIKKMQALPGLEQN